MALFRVYLVVSFAGLVLTGANTQQLEEQEQVHCTEAHCTAEDSELADVGVLLLQTSLEQVAAWQVNAPRELELAAAASSAHTAANLTKAELRGAASYHPTVTSHFIPGTMVLMPADYGDYARGRTPIALFAADAVPGERVASGPPGPGLPSFDPATSSEVFMDALPTDPVGHRCAPGGDAAGHYFYNIIHPEIVPYLVGRNDSRNTGAAVIIAPGGGAIHLAWEPEGLSPAEWFNSLGVSAFVLKYRVPDETGTLQLMDAQRAMSLVRSRAQEYGIDPTRIGFMGSSAGGDLGLALQNSAARAYPAIDAADNVSYKPDFLVLNYPGIDVLRDLNPANVRNMPPTTLGFAEDDPCCGSNVAHMLEYLMYAVHNSSHLIMDFPEGRHGWGSCDYYPQLRGMEVCHWRERVQAFLLDNLILRNRTLG